jgi:DNA-binding response OmpR family regulator/2-oxo-4-hydroxy-4-carboxy--5-ureidoimidazoline (OHCU) decarboxylase
MKTILLIEDNDNIRENTSEILDLAGYRVLTAENGKTGVELALEHKPDLVICDIMMPVLDGYGVLHMFQRNQELNDIPFIFLTAKTERADFRKGMEMGADDYITKPFSGTDLLNAVESRLKKTGVRKQEFPSNLHGLDALMYAANGETSLKALQQDRDTNKFKKKQVIYAEGNHPINLFFIQKGKVKTFKRNDEGKEFVTELYNTGDFLGHIALLEGSTYKETAEAMEETELALIPREDFEELLNNHPEVAGQFIRMLANNVTAKEEQLVSLAYNSLRKKVAEALMQLRRKYGDEKEMPFAIDISRESLATIAGTATESVIRTLGSFREEKLIDIKEGMIIILDEKRLDNMLN